MSTFSPSSFPLTLQALESTPKRLGRFLESLERLDVAHSAKQIYNPAYVQIKHNLNPCLEQAWEAHVSKPHLWGKGGSHTPAENELNFSISISTLNDVLSAQKKLDKFKESSPMADAMRKVIDEWHPVATAVKALKDNVLKGRAPSSEPAKPVNPNKDVKTCPCCFRPIAVVSSTMAHHGYKRPEQGFQTSSCPGIRFKPLEISNEGLIYILDMTRQSIKTAQKDVENLPNVTSLHRKTHKGMELVTRGDPIWPQLHEAYSHQTQRHLIELTREELMLSQMLDKWEPTVVSTSRKREEPSSPSP